MGTFIRYLIYIVLVVAVFFILKGLWDGEMQGTSTPVVTEEIINTQAN